MINEMATLSSYIGDMVLALVMKDWVANLITGLKFKFDEGWHEGAHCYVDREPALIVKIGISETIFQIPNGHGTVWRYISADSGPRSSQPSG